MKKKITIQTLCIILSLSNFVMRQFGTLTRNVGVIFPLLMLGIAAYTFLWDADPLSRMITNMSQNDTISRLMVRMPSSSSAK